MKNIAEYFRDLAAGDRFFGAEPPQPDPEMLQSIAEQTIKARVNAQLTDNNLVLSQQGATGTAAPLAAAAAAQPAPVTPEVMPAPAPAPGVETVAEKLQRIRAVVSRETAQDAFFSEDQHVEEFASETTAPFGSFEAPEDNVAVQPEAPAQTQAPEPQVEEISADATLPQEEAVEPETLTADIAEDVKVDEPIAQQPSDDTAEEFTAADEALEDSYEEEASDEAPEIDLSALSALASDDVTDEPVVEDAAEEVVAEEVTAEEIVAEAAASLEDTVSEEVDFADEDAALESALASINTEDEAAEELTEDEPEIASTLEDALAREEAAEAAVDDVLGRVSDEDTAEEETEAVAPRRRIVVQKITREDLKAARTQAEETAETETLSAEAEADLQRELAALKDDATDTVEAEELEIEEETVADVADDKDLSEALAGLVSEDAAVYEAEEKEAARATRIARREAIAEDQKSDVDRLMEATTSRIDNDESSNRRASIAHLKAAVAATKADSSLAEAAQEQEARERDQYAEDLARIVRPERTKLRDDASKTDRPSPLVLVSELRIDNDEDKQEAQEETSEDAPASEGPIRPRRVSRAALDEADDVAKGEDTNIFNDPGKTSFAEYAAAAKALELPDLLEAAAAYYTYVESTEQFTRPMLMRKIASVSNNADGFSREAGLRSFGTLLREGKLVKGTDGKFVIAKNSRFTPEARYAGE